MAKDDGSTGRQPDRKDRETRGGYPAGGKQVSDFRPPPSGPAPGAKRPDEEPDRGDDDPQR